MADHSATELRQPGSARGERTQGSACIGTRRIGWHRCHHGGCGPADGGRGYTGDGTKKHGIKIKPEEAEIILTGVEHRHYDLYKYI